MKDDKTMLQGILKSRYEKEIINIDCSIHTGCPNNLFCLEHSEIVCLKCRTELHDKCSVMSINDTGESINTTEQNKLKCSIYKLSTDIESYKSLVENNILKVETRRSDMIKEAQTIHGKLVEKINYIYYETKAEIAAVCEEISVRLSKQKARIDMVLSNLNSCQCIIEEVADKDIRNVKELGSIQEIVIHTKKCTNFLNELQESVAIGDLSFKPNEDLLEILDSPFCFGSVATNSYNCNTSKIIPNYSLRIAGHGSDAQTEAGNHSKCVGFSLANRNLQNTLDKMKSILDTNSRIVLRYSVNVQTEYDTKGCQINDIVVISNSKRVLADYTNQKLKLFSPNMKLLSALSLSAVPHSISYTNMNEVIVCSKDKILRFIDISNDKLTTKHTLKLKFTVHDVIACEDQLYVSCGTTPASIKKIDRIGRSVWTVCKNKQGQKHFKSICHITCSALNNDIRVVATDYEAETATMIDGETGNVLAVRQLKGKGPRRITSDFYGNIYICYVKTNEICMMTRDLAEDTVLLSIHNGMSPDPLAIAYDYNSDQIIISTNVYIHRDTVTVFQKSFYI